MVAPSPTLPSPLQHPGSPTPARRPLGTAAASPPPAQPLNSTTSDPRPLRALQGVPRDPRGKKDARSLPHPIPPPSTRCPRPSRDHRPSAATARTLLVARRPVLHKVSLVVRIAQDSFPARTAIPRLDRAGRETPAAQEDDRPSRDRRLCHQYRLYSEEEKGCLFAGQRQERERTRRRGGRSFGGPNLRSFCRLTLARACFMSFVLPAIIPVVHDTPLATSLQC